MVFVQYEILIEHQTLLIRNFADFKMEKKTTPHFNLE